jgi:tRNA dimethylallyltransferase
VHAPTALCIAGPTATGKTDLALAVADRCPVEVISVDSAMVYRGLDIGTAKPAPELRERVPHHLIDIRQAHETYSAGEFRRDALRLIDRIHASGRLPVLVGGTLLYFRALMRGIAPLPHADERVRAEINARAAELGWPALHEELAQVDPAAAAKIGTTDRQRIQRALEVHTVTGRPISELQRDNPPPPDVRFLAFALVTLDRPSLHARIEQRFDQMLADGLLDEVRRLRSLPGMHSDLPAARAVGYRQLWAHLDGEFDLEEARSRAITATRRYAKRQMTWLRSEGGFQRLERGTVAALDAALSPAGGLDAICGSSG